MTDKEIEQIIQDILSGKINDSELEGIRDVGIKGPNGLPGTSFDKNRIYITS